MKDFNLDIKNNKDGFIVHINIGDEKIGEIIFEKESKNNYTIIDAKIDPKHRGERIYQKSIIKIFDYMPNITINSVFRSPEADKAWKYLIHNLPDKIDYKKIHFKEENTILYQLKLKNNLQESIRRILREESESMKQEGKSKVNLVKKMIYNMYDNISFIKQSTYKDKPLLTIYFDSDDPMALDSFAYAANIESWFKEKISRDIDEWTSGNIIVCPDYVPRWDYRSYNADVYINTKLQKHDDLGNDINESSELKKETQIPSYIKRRVNLEELDKIFEKNLKSSSDKLKINKKKLNSMTIDKFIVMVVSSTITDIFSEKLNIFSISDEPLFQKIWVFIDEHYREKIKKVYQEIMYHD